MLRLEEISSNTGMSPAHCFLLWALEDLHAVGDLGGWPTFGVRELGDHYERLGRAWWVMARIKFSNMVIVKMLGHLANTHEKGVQKCVCVFRQARFG